MSLSLQVHPNVSLFAGQKEPVKLDSQQTSIFFNESVDVSVQTIDKRGENVVSMLYHKVNRPFTRLSFHRLFVVFYVCIVLNGTMAGLDKATLATGEMEPTDIHVQAAVDALQGMSAQEFNQRFNDYIFNPTSGAAAGFYAKDGPASGLFKVGT